MGGVSGFTFSAKSIAQLSKVHPRMVAVVKLALDKTTQDFVVHDGARTAEEQNALFKSGASQKDGYKNKSNHQVTSDGFGHAVDLVPFIPGKGPVWDWDLIYPVAVAMSLAAKELGVRIRWGGNWFSAMNDYGSTIADIKEAVERYKSEHPGPDFIDGPHFELIA